MGLCLHPSLGGSVLIQRTLIIQIYLVFCSIYANFAAEMGSHGDRVVMGIVMGTGTWGMRDKFKFYQ